MWGQVFTNAVQEPTIFPVSFTIGRTYKFYLMSGVILDPIVYQGTGPPRGDIHSSWLAVVGVLIGDLFVIICKLPFNFVKESGVVSR